MISEAAPFAESRTPSLLWVSIICGAAYFATLSWQPFPGSIVLKGLSIACLALLAGSMGDWLLAFGLAASSVGDVLLEIRSVDLFVTGLWAFLAAHVIYSIRFVRLWERPLWVAIHQRMLLGAVAAYSVLITAWLWSSLGAFRMPIAFYICAITAMVGTAIIARSPWPVILGTILFLASDSMIAVAFKGTFPFRTHLVWGTYYLAQYGIATGRHNRKTSA